MEHLKHDLEYLKLLSRSYPTISSASSEIINLNAYLHLPKGTEHFLSDIHGEFDAFNHIIKSGSGVIKDKINEFLTTFTEEEKNLIATVIYYPYEKLDLLAKENKLDKALYKKIIYGLIDITRVVASKYSRVDVRSFISKEYQYVIEELLHSHEFTMNKEAYYEAIIDSIIVTNRANEYIVELTNLIKKCSIAHLHILGDIFDRGDGAFRVIELLKRKNNCDITWGNHDVEYMGACAGNMCCVANVIRNSCRYNHLSTLEEGYGISLRPLIAFAMQEYKDDPCSMFIPDAAEANDNEDYDTKLIAKMHKAITIIQLKLDGQIVDRHPNYKADYMKKLLNIDFKNGTYTRFGKTYELADRLFPTVDPKNPFKLTKEEEELIEKLTISFRHSENLNDHVDFLFKVGSMYLKYNDNLLFHGCIPLNEDGSYLEYTDEKGNTYKGIEYLDYCDKTLRKGYYNKYRTSNHNAVDFFYFMWCMSSSPLFGKSDITTFERYFLSKEDSKNFKEEKNPYYIYSTKKEWCSRILEEFGLDKRKGKIINGHVPVKIRKGESPIKAGGKLIIIDGGICKAYQGVTGIAGYTLISNSHGMKLIAHEPFHSKEKAIKEDNDMLHSVTIINSREDSILIKDTYNGKKIKEKISELLELVYCYEMGYIKSN